MRLRTWTVFPLDGVAGPINFNVNESPLFFSFKIAHIADLENNLILLNVSNRCQLQIYLDRKTAFPDSENHFFSLGDVSETVLEKLFKSSLKMETFEESSPFVYDIEMDKVIH